MIAPRVRLALRDRKIELEGYEPDATIGDLVAEVERFRLSRAELVTSTCAACGLCCHQNPPVFAADRSELRAAAAAVGGMESALVYPTPPDPAARAAGIRELERDMGMSPAEATRTYEYNQAEPITLRHGEDGMCVFLHDGLCSIYPHRPLTCRLYVCNMGPRLECLQERIVTEGTWHAYQALGWMAETDLEHNAFRAAPRPLDLLLSLFERPETEADPEKLFFYY